MVEVFKTNVKEQDQANMLLDKIHKTYIHYTANFDLEDCDNILRVVCKKGPIKASELICLLQKFGSSAEILQDEINPYSR
jgi:hypothetical protein